jgi:hypothetical protein
VKHKKIPDPRSYNPAIPEDLTRIVMKALERDIFRRYQTAGEMGYDLEYYMYHDRFGPTNVALSLYLRELFAAGSGGEKPHDGTSSDRLVRQRGETLFREL